MCPQKTSNRSQFKKAIGFACMCANIAEKAQRSDGLWSSPTRLYLTPLEAKWVMQTHKLSETNSLPWCVEVLHGLLHASSFGGASLYTVTRHGLHKGARLTNTFNPGLLLARIQLSRLCPFAAKQTSVVTPHTSFWQGTYLRAWAFTPRSCDRKNLPKLQHSIKIVSKTAIFQSEQLHVFKSFRHCCTFDRSALCFSRKPSFQSSPHGPHMKFRDWTSSPLPGPGRPELELWNLAYLATGLSLLAKWWTARTFCK